MQNEEPPVILRRNNRRNGLIQSAIVICSIILIGILTMKVKLDDAVVEKKVTKEVEVKEVNFTEVETEIAELSAGVSKDILLMAKKSQPEEPLAGLSKQILEFSKEPLPKVEKRKVETVSSPAKEPEKVYKSLDEVKISRNMDLTKTTGLSKKDFCKLLADFKYDYAGFYKRNAKKIWDMSQKYQVNEIFMCGVFALESYYGSDDRHTSIHNYGSIMNREGEMVKYASDEEGIKANYKLFSNCYLTKGGKYYKGVTLDSIGDTYCPPTPECPSWADEVYNCMQVFLKN